MSEEDSRGDRNNHPRLHWAGDLKALWLRLSGGGPLTETHELRLTS